MDEELNSIDIIKKYGNEVKRQTGWNPMKARRMIQLGLFTENLRTKYKPDSKLPKAYRMNEKKRLKHLQLSVPVQRVAIVQKLYGMKYFIKQFFQSSGPAEKSRS